MPTLAPQALPGRIALVRDHALLVIEAGRTTTVVRPPLGGEVRTPAWSPDGQRIAYALTAPRPTQRGGRPSPAELPTTDLMVANADGSGARVAVAHDGPGGQVDAPAWTPDGRGLVYGYYRATYNGDQFFEDTVEVRRADLANGATTTLIRNASNPTLAGDGRWLAYLRDDPGGGTSLAATVIGEAAERILARPGDFAQVQAPAFSRDGAAVAFAASIAPRASRSAPAVASAIDLVRGLLPASAWAHGFPWEIWSVPTAGGAARQLTSIGEDSPYVRWSPDGTRLLVVAGGGLYLVDVTARTTAFVDAAGSHGGMDWRP